MSVGPVQSFVIEDEHTAASYLRDLLAKPEYRSMDVVRERAGKYIPDPDLKRWFLNAGQEALAS